MPIEPHELEAWAGPAWAELDGAQRERLARSANAIAARYPDPDDQDLRDAALSATVQHLLGETSLEDAAHELARTRRDEAAARAAMRQIVILSARDGVSEAAIAARTGLSRARTVRAWLGEA
ncbi:hypothetical protein [Nocardia puris]|uniref:hypothetical protein n=1 Tax=Nocardia puris TaxID=208602 RepID=UPI002E1FE9F5